MPKVIVRDMKPEDEYFVGTCSHVNESEEIDACGQRRISWLTKMFDKGSRVKVGLIDEEHAGFLYMTPIEQSPVGPLGKELSFIPCLYVLKGAQDKGLGKDLMAAAEEEAKGQNCKGIITIGYYHDFWFMPATFFEKIGFSVAHRKKEAAILWKVFDASAEIPKFLKPNYHYKPVTGKVVVDLFWNTFCETSDIEAQRIREVVKEFGQLVVLNEYCADDRDILVQYQIPRAIFVNGKETGWGYEAPKDGIQEAISQALNL